MPDPAPAEPVRFLDILTTATTVASFLGRESVGPGEMIEALAIVLGEKTEQDLGRPTSPMVSMRNRQAPVEPTLQVLVQRWFEALGGSHEASLSPAQLVGFRAELEELRHPPAP